MLVGIMFLCIGITLIIYGNSHNKENWKHVNHESSQIYCEFSVFFQFAKTSLPIVGGDYYVFYSIDSEY